MKLQPRFIPVTIVDESLLEATIASFYDYDGKVRMWEGDSNEGCFAAADINGVIYIDSELHGEFNSKDDKELASKLITAAWEYKEPWQVEEEQYNMPLDSPSLDMNLYY